MPSRRRFLQQLAAAGAALPFAALAGPATRSPFPYVDGMSFLRHPEDVAASGVSAFIADVSSVEQLATTDGSVKFYRSFEACLKSITRQHDLLVRGELPGLLLGTRGSDIDLAYRNGQAAVFLQFQGCEPIGTDLSRLDVFYRLGLRLLQVTHHNDNDWGGGAMERHWSGLSKTGFAGIERLNELRIIPDLSHASDPCSRDVLKVSKRPVIVSHGAARALVNNARCAPDDVIRGVAASGGVMGVFMVSHWLTEEAVASPAAFVRQIRHIVQVGGIDAVAVANDYDFAGYAAATAANNDNAKAVTSVYPWWKSVAREGVLGFDRLPAHVVIPEFNHVRRLFTLHETLDAAGFRSAEIEKIMGGNWRRVLTDTLG